MFNETLVERYGVDHQRRHSLFSRLVKIGAVDAHEQPGFANNRPFTTHWISGNVCEVAARRRAEIESTADKVNALEKRARSHPIAAVAIIAAVVFVFLVTAANQMLELIDKVLGDAPPAATADDAKQ